MRERLCQRLFAERTLDGSGGEFIGLERTHTGVGRNMVCLSFRHGDTSTMAEMECLRFMNPAYSASRP
jgi:hypothetical protein